MIVKLLQISIRDGINKKLDDIEKNEMILDIGPNTIKNIINKIDISNTVLWNGPAGYFENENFINGTWKLAKKISYNTKNKSLISIIGGGDTISAINKSEDELSHLHTYQQQVVHFLNTLKEKTCLVLVF